MVATATPAISENNFPYADTDAARYLRAALDALKREHKKSLRSVAKDLNYKQAAPLSHMATGRIPIPVERAAEIAGATGLDATFFLSIVLKQRYPTADIDFSGDPMHRSNLANAADPSSAYDWMAHNPTASQSRVIREVLRDAQAADRWLSPHEVSVIRLLRKLRPGITSDGLTSSEMEQLRLFLT